MFALVIFIDIALEHRFGEQKQRLAYYKCSYSVVTPVLDMKDVHFF